MGPALVAVAALIFGLVALTGGFAPRPTANAVGPVVFPEPAAPVTKPVANAPGGYTVQVPKGMTAKRTGPTTQITAKDRSLVITVVPTAKVDPALGNTRVLAAMESSYRTVRVTDHELQEVAGRRAVTSYGTALTTKGDTLRFVLVNVRGPKASYAISSFASSGSDPAEVLPRLRTVLNTFEIAK